MSAVRSSSSGARPAAAASGGPGPPARPAGPRGSASPGRSAARRRCRRGRAGSGPRTRRRAAAGRRRAGGSPVTGWGSRRPAAPGRSWRSRGSPGSSARRPRRRRRRWPTGPWGRPPRCGAGLESGEVDGAGTGEGLLRHGAHVCDGRVSAPSGTLRSAGAADHLASAPPASAPGRAGRGVPASWGDAPQKRAGSRYSPHSARSASQISPSVASARHGLEHRGDHVLLAGGREHPSMRRGRSPASSRPALRSAEHADLLDLHLVGDPQDLQVVGHRVEVAR